MYITRQHRQSIHPRIQRPRSYATITLNDGQSLRPFKTRLSPKDNTAITRNGGYTHIRQTHLQINDPDEQLPTKIHRLAKFTDNCKQKIRHSDLQKILPQN